jgi:hypothetical protein
VVSAAPRFVWAALLGGFCILGAEVLEAFGGEELEDALIAFGDGREVFHRAFGVIFRADEEENIQLGGVGGEGFLEAGVVGHEFIPSEFVAGFAVDAADEVNFGAVFTGPTGFIEGEFNAGGAEGFGDVGAVVVADSSDHDRVFALGDEFFIRGVVVGFEFGVGFVACVFHVVAGQAEFGEGFFFGFTGFFVGSFAFFEGVGVYFAEVFPRFALAGGDDKNGVGLLFEGDAGAFGPIGGANVGIDLRVFGEFFEAPAGFFSGGVVAEGAEFSVHGLHPGEELFFVIAGGGDEGFLEDVDLFAFKEDDVELGVGGQTTDEAHDLLADDAEGLEAAFAGLHDGGAGIDDEDDFTGVLAG